MFGMIKNVVRDTTRLATDVVAAPVAVVADAARVVVEPAVEITQDAANVMAEGVAQIIGD